MVPVAPLFNRFRRVIRDLAGERNKQVRLVIRGEKTELDKRMIDELGDPLLHLVRNALDHGLESAGQRRNVGKPETGTVVLEAAHRGHNVFITISDDGAGLNVARIRQRILEQELASETALAQMTEQQIIDHIWHPGFSTAEQVTDISGRGVGMDVVNNRIAELNGSIEVETRAGEGTSFKLRLPLTLAIIRCLLVRFRGGFFSMPIDDVREIVAVAHDQIHALHGSETIDVRGEFIPLIRMDRIFYWHGVVYDRVRTADDRDTLDVVNVVILHTAGRTIGLCVDELCGSADIVVKSLADNFADIRGLSGASIMGDGTVCLMLDISEVVKMAAERSSGARSSLVI
jgi:two-component system chemotaxis sensor kinase CheA